LQNTLLGNGRKRVGNQDETWSDWLVWCDPVGHLNFECITIQEALPWEAQAEPLYIPHAFGSVVKCLGSTVEGCEKDNWDLSPDRLTETCRTNVHLLWHNKIFARTRSHTVYQIPGFAESHHADRPNGHLGIHENLNCCPSPFRDGHGIRGNLEGTVSGTVPPLTPARAINTWLPKYFITSDFSIFALTHSPELSIGGRNAGQPLACSRCFADCTKVWVTDRGNRAIVKVNMELTRHHTENCLNSLTASVGTFYRSYKKYPQWWQHNQKITECEGILGAGVCRMTRRLLTTPKSQWISSTSRSLKWRKSWQT
jgi:hypothetical protein